MSVGEIYKRKIYLASSWRNAAQPYAVKMLREAGHEVYDFRNPPQGEHGFSWKEIDGEWQSWSRERFLRALDHPIAEHGFTLDWSAMQWADTGVLYLPCGRSAHLEAGYFTGARKELYIVLARDPFEPELMYKMADRVFLNEAELVDFLSRFTRRLAAARSSNGHSAEEETAPEAMATGLFLKESRRRAGLALGEAAQRLGLDSYELLGIEDGTAEIPAGVARRLTDLYGLHETDLELNS